MPHGIAFSSLLTCRDSLLVLWAWAWATRVVFPKRLVGQPRASELNKNPSLHPLGTYGIINDCQGKDSAITMPQTLES